jgi:hypothetical protein
MGTFLLRVSLDAFQVGTAIEALADVGITDGVEVKLDSASGYAPKPRGRPPGVKRGPYKKKEATAKRATKKATPKYQSKKDRSLKWSGRGNTPVWLRDEMKGTKLKRDDFLIAGAA